MELLLNLAWLLLGLPAYWLWRNRKRAPAQRRFHTLQCLLALACALVILFPVVSATDDLHVMRAEMEESPASKRSVSHRANDKPAATKAPCQPALAATSISVHFKDVFEYSLPPSQSSPSAVFVVAATGRAPPDSAHA